MTPTKNQAKITSSLLLVSILFTITLTYATTEDGYKNEANMLPNISESTFTESGYKANIFINPEVAGAYASENNYKLNLAINPNGVGQALNENNYKLDLTPQKSFPDQHDLKVANIILSKTIVGKGYNVSITATVSNQELSYVTFNFTINADTTTINTQIITIPSKPVTKITFKWNTTDFTYGYYTVSAQAHPAPGEAFTADNTLTDGVVMVTIPGDADGDKRVNIFDILEIQDHWYPGPPLGPGGYDRNVDLDDDTNINIFDILIVQENWDKSW